MVASVALGQQVTVVIATRNRWPELARTLGHLTHLPDRPAVTVVDNASSDGTAARVAADFPAANLVSLPVNLGAAARTVGIRLASTPLVAFSDDDSWWEAEGLGLAARRFADDPALGLLAGRILVGDRGALDPVTEQMAAGPLDEWLRRSAAGRRGVTGFLACAAVVRRRAIEAIGGFEAHLLIGGEEELVALDLANGGWKLVYDPDVVAHHHPSTRRDAPGRQRLLVRNRLLTAWLRYPLPAAVCRTRREIGPAASPAAAWPALASAVASLPWALAHRAPVTASVAAAFTAGGGRGRET
ncbi:MAG: glycosyltransferase family 2 protein [Acidimicrobiales bacterium]